MTSEQVAALEEIIENLLKITEEKCVYVVESYRYDLEIVYHMSQLAWFVFSIQQQMSISQSEQRLLYYLTRTLYHFWQAGNSYNNFVSNLRNTNTMAKMTRAGLLETEE